MTVESGYGQGFTRSYTRGEAVKTKPGETHDVIVGGQGQNVIGQIVVPKNAPEFNWGYCTIEQVRPQVAPPSDLKQWPDAKQTQWWIEQQAQENEFFKLAKSYTFAVEDDGTFRVDALPPADYLLRVTLWAKNTPVAAGPVTLATAKHRFSVKKPIDNNKPIDLGPITAKLTDQAMNSGGLRP